MDRNHLRTDAGKEKRSRRPNYSRIPAAAAVVEAFHVYGIRTPSVHIGLITRAPRLIASSQVVGRRLCPIQQWMGQPVRCGTVRSIGTSPCVPPRMEWFPLFTTQSLSGKTTTLNRRPFRSVTTLCMAGEIQVPACSGCWVL